MPKNNIHGVLIKILRIRIRFYNINERRKENFKYSDVNKYISKGTVTLHRQTPAKEQH